MPSFAHAFYFWFSMIFLIGRTLAVSLYASEIHDESKKPIMVTRAVPKEAWCTEIVRFAEEATNDTIGFSGMRFFYLTRKLILSVGSFFSFHFSCETDNNAAMNANLIVLN